MAKSMLFILAILALMVAWFGLSATDSCDDLPEGNGKEACYILQEGG